MLTDFKKHGLLKILNLLRHDKVELIQNRTDHMTFV